MRYADQAIADEKADAAERFVVLAIAAARQAENDELAKQATMRYAEPREGGQTGQWSSEPIGPTSPPAREKLSIPPEREQARAHDLIEEIYGEQRHAAQTSAQKQALATKLLEKASESGDDVDRYALLTVARDAAVEAGDVQLAFNAIDEIVTRYDVDAYKPRGAALSEAAKSATLQEHRGAIAELSMQLIDEAVDRDDFAAGKYLGELALDVARKSRDYTLVKQIEARNKEVEELAAAYGEIQEALAALKANPVDPEANLAVGRYYCFLRGNWDWGLPMLALGNDEKLRALALNDLRTGSDADGRLAIGDA